MIIEYQRPKTIPEALFFLARDQPVSYPLGGGTILNRGMEGQFAVIDLQELEFGTISRVSNQVQLGATVTLQELLDFKGLPEDLYPAIKHEATYNIRQIATIAGTLVTANGRSPFAATMLALDASLEILELDAPPRKVRLGDWFPVRTETKPGQLITKVTVPLKVTVVYEYIARTPADQPIVCTAIARWTSGRTRVALGGWGKAPILAMDGPNSDGIEIACRSAYIHAGDEWASAEYRQEMAGILAMRCLQRIYTG
jgi:CO/xanthine dehydrogenase FAD-binding subunit